ncbi:hypothetical protein EON65_56150 [archaeon]|nr:MAG: hypothetical protein EON65_56150 [archaeon]
MMGVIAFACVFSVGAGLYLMMATPDARLSKSNRKNPLRGDARFEQH